MHYQCARNQLASTTAIVTKSGDSKPARMRSFGVYGQARKLQDANRERAIVVPGHDLPVMVLGLMMEALICTSVRPTCVGKRPTSDHP